MNLLIEQWIPIKRKSGLEERIAPFQITETDDPVISLNAPRADFNGALMEFLIGLLQTTAAPANHDKWVDWLESPPSPETLKDSFNTVSKSFELHGEDACFMQDLEEIDGEPKQISALLIDAPGANALKNTTDHFIKRGNAELLCESCSATALFTLQAYAPAGGVGYRTSLRGGGPLTTLVVLDPKGSNLEDNLWRNLWLNILDKPNFDDYYGSHNQSQDFHVFPWLAATRTSESKTGQDTFIQQVNPLQMYWGMPRRIKLLWNVESAPCSLCGEHSEMCSHEYITKNYGVNYKGVWQHPLSPHYIEAKSGEPLPVHAQPEGLSYRHWLGWAQGTETIKMARVVALFNSSTKRKLANEQFRLSVFGYDMDNMKARGWHQIIYPLYPIEEKKLRSEFIYYSHQLIDAANQVANFTQSCIKEAWFKRPKDVRGDTGFIKEAFYQQTEAEFYRTLESLLQTLREQGEASVLQNWHQQLKQAAFKLFDYWATRSDVSISDPRRIAIAHQKLNNLIHGKKFLGSLGITINKEEVA